MKKLAVALGAMVCALCASGSAVAGPVFDLSATTLDARNNSGQNTFSLSSMLLGSIQLTDAAGMRIMAGMPTEFGVADIPASSSRSAT